MNTERTLAQRCAAIELLVVDVDGVLTDGGIIHGTGELEIKRFHVRDGFGLRTWQNVGKRTALITGRSSPVVDLRAREVGIDFVYQNAPNKMPAFQELLEAIDVAPERVCYIGDDLPDLAPQRNCGLAVAVADAMPEVRHAAHYITQKSGGCGAVRDTIELILRCQGRW